MTNSVLGTVGSRHSVYLTGDLHRLSAEEHKEPEFMKVFKKWSECWDEYVKKGRRRFVCKRNTKNRERI